LTSNRKQYIIINKQLYSNKQGGEQESLITNQFFRAWVNIKSQ